MDTRFELQRNEGLKKWAYLVEVWFDKVETHLLFTELVHHKIFLFLLCILEFEFHLYIIYECSNNVISIFGKKHLILEIEPCDFSKIFIKNNSHLSVIFL